jgi:hypothetical protein
MKVSNCVVAATFASVVLAADPAPGLISSHKLSNTQYELTVTLQDNSGVFAKLVHEAKTICGEQPFEFGPYSFNSTKRTGNGNGPSGPGQLNFKQEITCRSGTSASSIHASYEWSPVEADNELVAARTQEYLAQKNRGELALAYSQFSDALKASARFDAWSKTVEDFNTKAGSVEFRNVQKVSWVKDPQGVDPGFYAAVDYAGRFHNIAFECGYIAWYRDRSGRLAIVHEEEGNIDRESQGRMSRDELQKTLLKIGCVSN